MEPSIWGPHGWFFLHSVTMNYPEKPNNKDRHNYRKFFEYVGKVLPCSKCQNNFNKHTSKFDLEKALNSRDDLVIWLFNIHNEANITLGKSIISYTDFLEKYKDIYIHKKNKTYVANNINNNKIIDKETNYKLYLIILLILYIVTFIFAFGFRFK